MSFLKSLAAGFMENAARGVEQQRDYAQNILDSRGDRLTDAQRQKVEAYAYSDVPERAREIASNLRRSDD